MTKRVKSAAAASRQKPDCPRPHTWGAPRGLRPSLDTTGIEKVTTRAWRHGRRGATASGKYSCYTIFTIQPSRPVAVTRLARSTRRLPG